MPPYFIDKDTIRCILHYHLTVVTSKETSLRTITLHSPIHWGKLGYWLYVQRDKNRLCMYNKRFKPWFLEEIFHKWWVIQHRKCICIEYPWGWTENEPRDHEDPSQKGKTEIRLKKERGHGVNFVKIKCHFLDFKCHFWYIKFPFSGI